MYTNCWSTLLSNKGNNSQTINNTCLRHKGTFAVPDSRVGSETKSHIQHERCTFLSITLIFHGYLKCLAATSLSSMTSCFVILPESS